MELLIIMLLISLPVSIALLVFSIWVMYTVAKSLKEISRNTEKIADQMTNQTNKEDAKTTGEHQNCWDEVFTND